MKAGARFGLIRGNTTSCLGNKFLLSHQIVLHLERRRQTLPRSPFFLTLPRAYSLCVFTQGGIIHLYMSRHLRAPWIFKALMFGCLMQLPKQLAITGLPEILPARFLSYFLQCVWIAKIKYPFEASPCCLLGRCFLQIMTYFNSHLTRRVRLFH